MSKKDEKKEIKIVDGVQRIDITKVVPYENNARINDHVVEALARCIERFGFNEPIVLAPDNVIVCGHTRVKAALRLGMTEVPYVYTKNLTQEEIDAYRLADNKIAEQALWDYEKLNKEIAKIGDKIAMTDFGFKPEDFVPAQIDGEDPIDEEDDGKTLKENCFRIIVECDDENDAEEKFNALVKEGYKCSLSTL